MNCSFESFDNESNFVFETCHLTLSFASLLSIKKSLGTSEGAPTRGNVGGSEGTSIKQALHW